MAEANGMLKSVGSAGMLLAFVGILAFFAGVFSLAPRASVFVGAVLIVLSFVAFFIQEYGPRR